MIVVQRLFGERWAQIDNEWMEFQGQCVDWCYYSTLRRLVRDEDEYSPDAVRCDRRGLREARVCEKGDR